MFSDDQDVQWVEDLSVDVVPTKDGNYLALTIREGTELKVMIELPPEAAQHLAQRMLAGMITLAQRATWRHQVNDSP